MNIPKHTPGPWKIAGESNTVHEAHIIESESRTICWTADTIGEDDDEFTSDEDLANALLIAKAPDLLFAAKCPLPTSKASCPSSSRAATENTLHGKQSNS